MTARRFRDRVAEILRAEEERLRIAHDRAADALTQAAMVPPEDLNRGIRALTAERDRLKAEGERLSLGLVRMQKIAAAVDADLRAVTAERDGLKHTLEMWVAECGEGGPRPIKANVKALAEALTKLMEWGVELNDERLHYVSVQVERADIALARAALARDGVRRGRREKTG